MSGLSLPAFMLTIAVGIAAVVGRNSRAMLWWRYGVRPANDFERDAILTAIIPIALLRGRNQPAIWIGHRLGAGHAAMPNRANLIVALEFGRQVAHGQLTDRQASAIISRALGAAAEHDSTLVNVIDAHCLPWRIVQIFTGAASQIAARSAMLGFSWRSAGSSSELQSSTATATHAGQRSSVCSRSGCSPGAPATSRNGG